VSHAAVIITVPGARPVTSPAADTVAIDVSAELHVTASFVSGSPSASRGVAVNCCVPPTSTSVEAAGVTATDRTADGLVVSRALHAIAMAMTPRAAIALHAMVRRIGTAMRPPAM
jgi:hypothetical protein